MYEPSSSKAQQAFIKQIKKQRRTVAICRWLILLSFLFTWELLTRIGVIDPFIFSSPTRIVYAFIRMVINRTIFYHLGMTLFETFISFFLSCSLGIIIAIMLWWNTSLAKILEPYLVVLNSLPKTALAPIIIVWLGNTLTSIIFIAIIVSIIVTIMSVYSGFSHVDAQKILLIQTFGGKKKAILQKVIIPANIPTIINAMKVNIGLSLIGVIIGEFLAAKAGLGYLIVYGSQVFKLDWVMMSVIILGLLATILYQGVILLEKKIKKK